MNLMTFILVSITTILMFGVFNFENDVLIQKACFMFETFFAFVALIYAIFAFGTSEGLLFFDSVLLWLLTIFLAYAFETGLLTWD